MATVLLVEDDQPLLRALAMNFAARGYEVVSATSGTRALATAAAARPDVIVLDLGLPDLTGFDVIRGIRAYEQTPIIVLSARTDGADKVQALDLGADDYVTKPFNVDELLARVRATTRRASADERATEVRIGAVSLDLVAGVAIRDDGERIHLTPTQWHLLAVLVRHPGRLVTRAELLTELRGSPDHTDPSYLRIYVAQLRRKLEEDPSRPRHILTESGLGYRFEP